VIDGDRGEPSSKKVLPLSIIMNFDSRRGGSAGMRHDGIWLTTPSKGRGDHRSDRGRAYHGEAALSKMVIHLLVL
jgi:hypothetical protein